MRVGIDVGAARVGVAVCDPDGLLATPLTTLRRDLDGWGDVEEVVEVVADRSAVGVVVGLPRSLDGAERAAAQHVREWCEALRTRLNARPGLADTPIRLVDERLTTVDAHRGLHASGLPGRSHRTVVDQAAAVLILQAAIDRERSLGEPLGELFAGPPARKPRRKDGRR
ncbi:Holliday junction resolvase RuvX [Marihabitans asiaticum]|uniref:Putative pre-16S rRNA nuclease n=1 Tax=Marihabitans asiaticum TaxID=415218 RepID=A0A560WAM2_9MICO|nr:Holliday junction resolvase RuvX [Marihabitans asiaticum]TWD14679.1 putative Holliday junction resolvase [Marihabitans asiaticum]